METRAVVFDAAFHLLRRLGRGQRHSQRAYSQTQRRGRFAENARRNALIRLAGGKICKGNDGFVIKGECKIKESRV